MSVDTQKILVELQQLRQDIKYISRALGIEESDEDLRDDLRFIRKQRQSSEDVRKWVARSAITVVITGALFVMWEGIKLRLKGQ